MRSPRAQGNVREVNRADIGPCFGSKPSREAGGPVGRKEKPHTALTAWKNPLEKGR